MKLVDRMLGDALGWQQQNPELVVVFASSMGQGPVYRKDRKGQLLLKDLAALMSYLGLSSSDYEPRMAMVPQVAFAVDSLVLREKLVAQLEKVKSQSGASLFKIKLVDSSVSLTLNSPDEEEFSLRQLMGPEDEIVDSLKLGIVWVPVEKGTGYHIPEGIFAYAARGIEPSKQRSSIPLSKVKNRLLELGGLILDEQANRPMNSDQQPRPTF